MPDFRLIGTPAPRVDGAEKVTGRARYAAAHPLPKLLWGRVMHGARLHARIVRIDTSAAAALAGVHAVITGADVRGHLYGRAVKDMPALADGRVRYAGERVAAVAAEDEDVAREALDLIEVEYEELPAVFDVEEALRPDAPQLHDDPGGYPGARVEGPPWNRHFYSVADRGDLAAGFAGADVVVEHTYETPRVHQAYLEPHTSTVAIEGRRVHVWTNTKVSHGMRDVRAFTAGARRASVSRTTDGSRSRAPQGAAAWDENWRRAWRHGSGARCSSSAGTTR